MSTMRRPPERGLPRWRPTRESRRAPEVSHPPFGRRMTTTGPGRSSHGQVVSRAARTSRKSGSPRLAGCGVPGPPPLKCRLFNCRTRDAPHAVRTRQASTHGGAAASSRTHAVSPRPQERARTRRRPPCASRRKPATRAARGPRAPPSAAAMAVARSSPVTAAVVAGRPRRPHAHRQHPMRVGDRNTGRRPRGAAVMGDAARPPGGGLPRPSRGPGQRRSRKIRLQCAAQFRRTRTAPTERPRRARWPGVPGRCASGHGSSPSSGSSPGTCTVATTASGQLTMCV